MNESIHSLVELANHRQAERIAACGGVDPLEVVAAYAQDALVYTPDNRTREATPEEYAAAADNDKVNKFRQTYREGAPILLHRTLADIVVDAAIDLYNHPIDTTQAPVGDNRRRWKTRVYDGLRTMDAGTLMMQNADPKWLGGVDAQGNPLPALLAAPGNSAHNRALAVDSVTVDREGREIERFDNLFPDEKHSFNMEPNHRDYAGGRITEFQREARLIKERAMQRAALGRGTVIAPLMSEYWDDRPPGSQKDLWRVMASIRRCIGEPPLPETARAEDYATFKAQWESLDPIKLQTAFGSAGLSAPAEERILYHETLAPIYDAQLPESRRIALEGHELTPPGAERKA